MKKYIVVLGFLLCLNSCAKKLETSDFQFGDELNLSVLADSLSIDDLSWKIMDSLTKVHEFNGNSSLDEGGIPKLRTDLSNMKVVQKIYDCNRHFGIKIPGFPGLTLDKKQSNLNVYYIETKVVETDADTSVYGIGYSVHYLFNKVKKGIDIKNLASVAASAQLQRDKTSVYYSMQSYGIWSRDMAKYFKPQINVDFDVKGYGVVQTNINGIHNILTDSVLSSKTKYTPEKLYFVAADDVRQ